ncbi:MAG: agmatine deiminase family protein [Balneolaceae bacterium]|nr:agmatine deiminase family protein [Balneolaceae bacterium]
MMFKPIESNYRMPAEWESHAATQLHWPSNRDTWPGERLERVEVVYLDIIEILHRFEPVILLVDPSVSSFEITAKLQEREIDLSNVAVHFVPLNDVWARDCGPIFIKNSKREFLITDWEYNAWGEKYPPFDSDNALPQWFAETFNLPLVKTEMVLEGGSIDTNGEGVFLTTESVLLNKNRNPHLSKKEIEERLRTYLGAEQIIWLKEGLAGDDTDGHIDDLSRFLNRDTILTVISRDPSDVNYTALQENLEILKKAKTVDGQKFRIVTLPLPETKIEGTTVDGSKYVPASYANFYVANGAVLLPFYDKRYDQQALELFSEFFPEREIFGILCGDLVWGQGSIHCITQQLYGLKLKSSDE